MSNVTALKFKDEDSDGVDSLENVQIQVVANGYIVTYSYTNSEFTEVFTNKNDIVQSILENL
jgi:hypothetical protein